MPRKKACGSKVGLSYQILEPVRGGLDVSLGQFDVGSRIVLLLLDEEVAEQARIVVLRFLDRVVLDLDHIFQANIAKKITTLLSFNLGW